MKKILLPILLLLFVELSYAQINVYTFNKDSLWTEGNVRLAFETGKKTLPPNLILIPTIFHKVSKKDTIINYIAFVLEKGNPGMNKDSEFSFKQDSVFLFLNKKLPEFELKDLDGKKFSSTQFKGKPMLINFWATFCGPCIAEMPELSKLKEKYGNEMYFLGLTENKSKDDNLTAFFEKHPFNYQILQDAESYKKKLNISTLPRNIFVDKEGYIRYIQPNFPYKKLDSANGIKEFDENNYFVKIIEELIKKQ